MQRSDRQKQPNISTATRNVTKSRQLDASLFLPYHHHLFAMEGFGQPFCSDIKPPKMEGDQPKPFSFNLKRQEQPRILGTPINIGNTSLLGKARRVPIDFKPTQSFHLSENSSLQLQAQSSQPVSQSQQRPNPFTSRPAFRPISSTTQNPSVPRGLILAPVPKNVHTPTFDASRQFSSPLNAKHEPDHSLGFSYSSQGIRASPSRCSIQGRM